MNSQRRRTVVNLKHVSEEPLRYALESFDKDGDGKIDINELQRIIYWYGLWKYASIGLCMVIFVLVWSTFGLTIWAINLTKEYRVSDGLLTGKDDDVIKMSVASLEIPLGYASLLDRRRLDALDSLTLNITRSSGNFTRGMYHMKVAAYSHPNETDLRLYGQDGSKIWIRMGTILLKHPEADDALWLCGAATCNTFAVDVDNAGYLAALESRAAAKFDKDYSVGDAVEGIKVFKADGESVTCLAHCLATGCTAANPACNPVTGNCYDPSNHG